LSVFIDRRKERPRQRSEIGGEVSTEASSEGGVGAAGARSTDGALTDRVRVQRVQVLSDDWYVLKKTTFAYRRKDGRWQVQSRETYDRGNGATMLLYHHARGTVILTRQFRFPAYVNGHSGHLIEAPAGLLDDASPEARIIRETEEETGYRVAHVHKVFEAYMSPGSVTERLYFFVGEYDPASRVSDGGGVESEGEDIEVLELPLDVALEMIASGEIVDGKTIMLLQYAKLHLCGEH
jgi:nudix-type nucleoside diphosphatase (YffH/AdpP family)